VKERIEQILRASVAAWLARQGANVEPMPSLALTVPKDKAHGDFAGNAALVLGKKVGRNAREVAEEICAEVNTRLEGVAKCEVAGPGFLNFTLSKDAGTEVFASLLDEGERIGCSDIGVGKRANVEYVSANPTGPLSVGHGRNAAVGDVVANLLEAVGYDVTREYYFNDAGNQMTVLAQSVRTRYRQLVGIDEPLDEQGYQGEYIIDIARRVHEEHGDSLARTNRNQTGAESAIRDPRSAIRNPCPANAGAQSKILAPRMLGRNPQSLPRECWGAIRNPKSDDLDLFKQYAVEAMFSMIKDTLARMGVHHDVYFNERSLYDDGKIEETLKKIADLGLSYEKDGAVWFKASAFGAEKDRVLVKSTGEPTYRLPDVAYHIDKFARGYDWLIDVFGADHQAQYPDVLSCLAALGYDADKVTVIIYQFVTIVRDGQAFKMSTRKANYVTLDQLMDEVGVDATRYFFVMRRLGSHFEFDLELAKKHSLDNPVFYVQYAHARICSIFRHCAERKPGIAPCKLRSSDVDAALLAMPEEQDIVRQLAQFRETVADAARTCEPHRLTAYLEKLAELFHRYYNEHHVVVEDDALTRARLALALVTQRVVRNGLGMLGVLAPEKM